MDQFNPKSATLKAYEIGRVEQMKHIEFRRQLQRRTPLVIAPLLLAISNGDLRLAHFGVLDTLLRCAPVLFSVFTFGLLLSTLQKIDVHIAHLRSIEKKLPGLGDLGFETFADAFLKRPEEQATLSWGENNVLIVGWVFMIVGVTVAAFGLPPDLWEIASATNANSVVAGKANP